MIFKVQRYNNSQGSMTFFTYLKISNVIIFGMFFCQYIFPRLKQTLMKKKKAMNFCGKSHEKQECRNFELSNGLKKSGHAF